MELVITDVWDESRFFRMLGCTEGIKAATPLRHGPRKMMHELMMCSEKNEC